MAPFLFLILAVLCLGGAAGLIFARRPAHGALLVLLSLVSLGGIFGLLGASYAAAVQVLISAGAILVLFLFVLMMIDPKVARPPGKKRLTIAAGAGLGVVLLVELAAAVTRPGVAPPLAAASDGGSAAVGRVLFTRFLYPVEIAALLILAALVAAVTLARRKEAR
jgi:NADH-quinone oxidoreductase subunit J